MLVYVSTSPGPQKKSVARLVIDSASQRSYITFAKARESGLVCVNQQDTTVTGIGATRVALKTAECTFTISSLLTDEVAMTLENVQCLEKIGGKLARLDLDECEIGASLRKGLTERLPREESVVIDLLIGNDFMYDLLKGRIARIHKLLTEQGRIMIWDTIFGSAISGHFEYIKQSKSSNSLHGNTDDVNESENLTNALRQFWDWETLGITEVKGSIASHEEKFVDEHYLKNVKFDGKNYTVALPFAPEAPKPQNNFLAVFKQFGKLEGKLCRNPELFEKYVAAMNKYIDAGQVEEVRTATPKADKAYYLPHREVERENAESTKVRIVFNASNKDRAGISLNDSLLPGKALQPDLADILLGFRKHEIALTGDISQMFLMIGIAEHQRDYLRFLWKEHPGSEEPLKIYRFKVLPFGLNCAPYLAIRTVQHHLSTLSAAYPNAAESVDRQCYVDDFIYSGKTVAEVTQLRSEISEAMDKGSFHFSKWLSNSPVVMNATPAEDRAAAAPLVLAEKNPEYSTEPISSALGIAWDPLRDVFEFQGALALCIPKDKETMRTLCSRAAKIFDPLGFLSPFTVLAKMLMQQCWMRQLKWDDALPPEVLEPWVKWIEEIAFLSYIDISRPLCTHEYASLELHGFSDASEKACAAVVYGRFATRSGRVTVRLIMAKTKISPIKGSTIPRLELAATLLLARLASKIQQKLDLPWGNVSLWSDSTTAIQWLQKPSSSWKTFVGNRVEQVQKHYAGRYWRHVPTNENPADLGSRGIVASELMSNSFWFNGPQFLTEPRERWPMSMIDKTLTIDAQSEVKIIAPISLIMTNEQVGLVESIFLNDRPYWSNLRIFAMVLRFARNCLERNRERRDYGPITVPELTEATKRWVRAVQAKRLTSVIRTLEGDGHYRDAKLKQLQPYIDETDGLLRVGGRLHMANLPYESKHPAILPAKEPIVRKYLMAVHKAYTHAGPATLLSIVRSKFWLMSGLAETKSVTHECACYLLRAEAFRQIVAPLLYERVHPSPPFTFVGMDNFGPISYFDEKKPAQKAYGLIFTCCSTRAVHIELVKRLDTICFVNGLKRMIARRGIMKVIFCDNAQTFRHTRDEIQKLYRNIDLRKVRTLFQSLPDPIEFRMNPARAPHWGGHYERMIWSVKKALKSVLGKAKVDFDTLQTVLCQTEAIVNSRPLAQLSSSPLDPSTITPAQLVIGRNLMSLPDNLTRDVDITKLSVRWRKRQRQHSELWTRWVKEYLATLQPFSKWLKEGREPKVGEKVLIGDFKPNRLNWPIAVVQELHPSRRDGLTRMVTLKKYDPEKDRTKILTRDIRHLYKLEAHPVPAKK